MKLIMVIFLKIFICLLCEQRRFIFEMFRHGARSSWKLDENNKDIYGEKWNGDTELTEAGMRQQYLLGYRNRQQFSKFISEIYNPNEIYVISTSKRRTIMSAYAQLQGFYQPGKGQLLSQEQSNLALPPIDGDFKQEIESLKLSPLKQNVQVIPVQLFDSTRRDFDIHKPEACPTVEQLNEKQKQDEKIKKFMSEKFLPKFGEKILKIINKDNKFYEDHWNVYRVFDCFIACYTDGRKLQAFVDNQIDKEEFLNLSKEFLNLDQYIVNYGDENSYVAKFSMSPTFRNIIKWIDTRISLDKQGKGDLYSGYDKSKFIMYSSHDSHLANVNLFLKVVFNEYLKNNNLPEISLYYPSYSSNFFLELYAPNELNSSTLESDYRVELSINGNTILTIKYPEFKKILLKQMISDIEIADYCKWNLEPKHDEKKEPETKKNSNGLKIATIILSCSTAILLGLVIFSCISNKKKTSNNYLLS